MTCDNPVTVSIHRDEHEPLDDQPRYRELMLSDEVGQTLLVTVNFNGDTTLRLVGHQHLTTMHLGGQMAQALVYELYEYLKLCAEWEEEQEVQERHKAAMARAVAEAERMTGGPSLEADYENGLLSTEEYKRLVSEAERLANWPVVLAQPSADLEPHPAQCQADSCQEAATTQAWDNRWYCVDHWYLVNLQQVDTPR